MTFLSIWEPQLRSIMRILFGFNFLTHGLQKTLGVLGGQKADLATQFGIAGLLETVGGALIVLGLFTRPTAFVLSGQMAVAFFMVHFPMGFFPIMNGGELATLYSFFFLWLAASGAGPWSADALLGKKA